MFSMNHLRIKFGVLISTLTCGLPCVLGLALSTAAQPLGTLMAPDRLVHSPSQDNRPLQAIVQLQGLNVPSPKTKGNAVLPLTVMPGTSVYTVPVTLGNHRGRFLFDTGASTSMLAPATVQELKLKGSPVPKERLGLAVAGDDCPNLTASIHKLPQLSMQGIQVQGLSTLKFNSTVIPEQLSGVLGMDVLKFFDVHLHPQRQAVQMRPATILPTEWRPHAVPLKKKLGVMLAQVRVNRQGPFTFLLDTGADSTFISPKVARQANLDNAKKQPINIRGFCGLEAAMRSQLTSVTLQTHQQFNLDTIILSSSSILSVLKVDGILGQNFLNRYQQYWRFTPDPSGQFDGSLLLFPLPPNRHSSN